MLVQNVCFSALFIKDSYVSGERKESRKQKRIPSAIAGKHYYAHKRCSNTLTPISALTLNLAQVPYQNDPCTLYTTEVQI